MSVVISTIPNMPIITFLFFLSSVTLIFLPYPVFVISWWDLPVTILAISTYESAISVVSLAHTIFAIASP